MKNIKLKKRFQAESVYYSAHYFLKKEEGVLSLYSKEEDALLHQRSLPFHVKRILVTENERFAFLYSGLFSSECVLYTLPNLHAVSLKLCFSKEECYIQDAVFGPQGKYLYLLVARKSFGGECVLIRVDLEDCHQDVFFQGEGISFKSIFYSESLLSLLLDDEEGNLYFFNQGKVVCQVKLRPFKEGLLIEKGEVYLLEEKNGFELFSKSGKSIQHCPLFLGKPNGEKVMFQEHFFHFTYDQLTNTLFYVSESVDFNRYRLYLFDLDDFSFVRMIELKKKPTFLKAEKGLLYLKTSDGFFVYRISGNTL